MLAKFLNVKWRREIKVLQRSPLGSRGELGRSITVQDNELRTNTAPSGLLGPAALESVVYKLTKGATGNAEKRKSLQK